MDYQGIKNELGKNFKFKILNGFYLYYVDGFFHIHTVDEKIYRLAILKNEIKQYSPKSYKLISALLSIRFKYSLSKDRQSRKEILDSIKSMVMRNSLTQAEIENNQKRRFWR